MKKNIFLFSIILLLLIVFLTFLTGCRTTDSIMFKKEFESLNSKEEYVDVNIKSDNPFVYISDSKLLEKIENKEDMVVLFGYSRSNETRSIIENLVNICKELNINTIYYLDIYDIRDEKTVNNDEIIVSEEGSESYSKLLNILNGYLDDYVIGNMVVGKRIYAPSILVLKNNNIKVIKDIDTDNAYNLIYNDLKEFNNNTCSVNEGC